jgi:hypothetical protein
MAESIENSPSSIDDEEEEENLDKLNKFVSTLDRFNTVIPETVAKYYMQQCALQTDDDRVVKLLSVSVQKFMSGKKFYLSQKLKLFFFIYRNY